MSRKFIGAILGAALTVTAFSAAPARADDRDLARFLGTAATLFIIGKAIESHNDRDRQRVHAPAQNHYKPKPKPKPQAHAYHPKPKPRPQAHNRWDGKGGKRWDHNRRNDRMVQVPQSCMREVGHNRYVVNSNCVSRNLPRR
ncbi:hypothetical protein VK792_16135 [Mesobacterium sp. TK19101]|uniref:Uncharacterized protein n=1 Tax=Mesobacterium hydrothermale TaxID=3111907 RepID=A0ABU6HN22_9RHOB|nr:hypothetical protein [Mesobacterium sp. TK19101]MEC3862823.1 hypothetical protein [Mesobacterium sp. TK19101]